MIEIEETIETGMAAVEVEVAEATKETEMAAIRVAVASLTSQASRS